jgi:hypothetical protein
MRKALCSQSDTLDTRRRGAYLPIMQRRKSPDEKERETVEHTHTQDCFKHSESADKLRMEARAPKPKKQSKSLVASKVVTEIMGKGEAVTNVVRHGLDGACSVCGKRHRSVSTATKCKARAEARAIRLVTNPEIPKSEHVKCPICGKVHRTVSAKERCMNKPVKVTPVKVAATVCPVCGKKHRKPEVAARCEEKAKRAAKADTIFEIAKQL